MTATKTRLRPNRAEVAKQAGRLMGKAFAPQNDEAAKEFIDALQRHSEDFDHLVRIVDRLVAIPGPFPEPAAISPQAEQCGTLRMLPDPNCKRCGGCGQRSTQFGGEYRRVNCKVPYHTGRDCEYCGGSGSFEMLTGGVFGATRCNCWDMREGRPEPI